MTPGLTCPGCGAAVVPAPDHPAGDDVPCPYCGSAVPIPFLLPEPDSVPQPPPLPPPRATRVSRPRSRRPAPPKPRTGRSPWVTVGIFAGLVAFAGCAATVGLVYAAWPVIADGVEQSRRPAAGPAKGPATGPPPVAGNPVPAMAPAAHPFDAALEDLKSDDPGRLRRGLDVFASNPEDFARKDAVSAALAAVPIDRHPEYTDVYLEALIHWAGWRNAPYVDGLAKSNDLPRQRAFRVARVKLKLMDTRSAARLLAPLVFRGEPYPGADEWLRKCHPGVDDVCKEAAFDPDPVVRRRAVAVLAAAWSDGKSGAGRKLYEWAFQSLDDPDPDRAKLAVGYIRDFHQAAPPNEATVTHLTGQLLERAAKQPNAPAVEPLADAVAGMVHRGNAPAVIRTIGGQPKSHPAVVKVFVAAAKFPSEGVAEHLIGWLGHPTAGPAAADGIKALGPAAEKYLRSEMATGSPEQRKRCRELLASLAGPAPPGEVKDATLRLLLGELPFQNTRDQRAAEIMAEIAALDPEKHPPEDRDAVVAILGKVGSVVGANRDRELPRALARWATEKHAQTVVQVALRGGSIDVTPLMPLLGRLKSEEAIRAIVYAAAFPANQDAAVAAITAVGPDAEKEVLSRLDGMYGPARLPTLCRMLEAIGTAKAVGPLERLGKQYATSKSAPDVTPAAAKAVEVIKARQEKEKK